MGLWEDFFGGLDSKEAGHVDQMLDQLGIKDKRRRREAKKIMGRNRDFYRRSRNCTLITDRVRHYREAWFIGDRGKRIADCTLELCGPLNRGKPTPELNKLIGVLL